MTLHAIVRHARAQLAAAGIPAEEAAMDADLLARHALGWDLATLISRAADEAPEGFETRFAALIDRRLRREPVAYIRGTQEFWGRDFVVGPGVLIPRPETEFIIEEAIAWAATHARSSASTRADGSGPAPLRILDIGAGSGCIAVTLALELPGAHVAATDTSPDALDTARDNQRRLGAEVTFHLGAFLADASGPVDLLVSNPPYVTLGEYSQVQPEVRDFEPVAALVSGEDGLDAIRGVVQAASTALAPQGLLLMEIGFGQAEAVRRIIERTDALSFIGFRDDLQGVPRIAKATRAQHRALSPAPTWGSM
jgi:release factor glutamine methyltransferase